MQIDVNSFAEGFLETMDLLKKGEDVFNMGDGPMFPTFDTQHKWKFAKYPNEIHLSDDQHVYGFKLPEGEHEDHEFVVERLPGTEHGSFGKGATHTGLAQVHRADPGSIYFTMQEGYKNPTYTFRHVGGTKWKGIPKKKAAKKTPKMVEVKSAEEFSNHVKVAFDWHRLNMNAGHAVNNTLKTAPKLMDLMASHPWSSALAGLGIGGAWDLGQRSLYNTEEENQQESPWMRMARWAAPAAALGGGAAFYNDLIPQRHQFQYHPME